LIIKITIMNKEVLWRNPKEDQDIVQEKATDQVEVKVGIGEGVGAGKGGGAGVEAETGKEIEEAEAQGLEAEITSQGVILRIGRGDLVPNPCPDIPVGSVKVVAVDLVMEEDQVEA